MDWALPPNYSTMGAVTDQLFWIIFWLTAVAFVLVEGGILWFCFKYRGREGQKAHYTHGSNRLEVIWTVIPILVFAALGIYSAQLWAQIRGDSGRPQGALEYIVVGKQFEWNITYPGVDRQLGTADDFIVRNQFHFPVGQEIIVHLESEDVIHSFFIPELRVKQDAVPGMTIPIWFDATQTGDFEIACAELCGLGHYRMEANVTVHEVADYEAWQASQVSAQ